MSDEFELLIVGGGPAGMSAARAFRGARGRGAVGIVADEHRMPYERPPLIKELLRGEATEADLPIEQEEWLAENQVSLICGRAVSLDPDARSVTLSGGRQLSYASCLLATGAEPTRLPIPGADDPAVLVVRTLDHVRELLHRLHERDPAIVIGSGFIGCEIAASLRRRGHAVALLSDEDAPNVGRLGRDAADRLRSWLEADGVSVHLGREVQAIERNGRELEVTAGTVRARAAIVVMATGVTPRTELAALAGLDLADGAIPVDASMRTSRGGLLAAGDVCRAENQLAGRPLRVEHWGDALGQGEIAGRNAANDDAVWAEVPGFWSTIGTRTLKYGAWGDGYDQMRWEHRRDGAFTAWYGRQGRYVGVLTHDADEDYERGGALIAEGAAWD